MPGQVFRGIGQFPVTVAAGAAGFAAAGPVGMLGAAALTTGGQMSTEFLNDMEQTVGKGYTDFMSNPRKIRPLRVCLHRLQLVLHLKQQQSVR